MALNVCGRCGTLFAIGVAHCPQCGNADYYPEGTMAKITVHGGPSDKTVTTASASAVVEPEPTPEEPELVEEPPAAADEPDLAEPEPPSVYEPWTLVDLRDECEARGLSKSGNKADLVARLVAADLAAVEDVEPVEDADPADQDHPF